MEKITDICIISEGSYPYTRGGVADWIEKLILNNPELKFSLFYIGSEKKSNPKYRYEFPENLLEYRETFLFDPYLHCVTDQKKKDLELFQKIHRLIYNICEKGEFFNSFEDLIDFIFNNFNCFSSLHNAELFYLILKDLSTKFAKDKSFIDIYWNSEFILNPILHLIQGIVNIPEAKIYHSVSTGYAGLAGSIARCIKNKPFFLTEHGIYTRERKMDINMTDWIYSGKIESIFKIDQALFFKKMWIEFFSVLSKIAYNYSDMIFSITRSNLLTQKSEGASENKLSLIPNGINIQEFSSCIKERTEIKKIALVGRVVPVKDILTFIKTAHLLHENNPSVLFEIIGPYEEDKQYFEICKNFIKTLEIENYISFTGRVDLKEKFKEIDLLMLTSISEGLPLVILEGFASGIPAVCTDVGGCPDLIYGNSELNGDIKIGNTGAISPVMDVQSLYTETNNLINNTGLYIKYQKNALERVKQFYSLEHFIDQYRSVYSKWLV